MIMLLSSSVGMYDMVSLNLIMIAQYGKSSLSMWKVPRKIFEHINLKVQLPSYSMFLLSNLAFITLEDTNSLQINQILHREQPEGFHSTIE